MEQSRKVARRNWASAQKARQLILEKTESLRRERGNINYNARFEEIENDMKELRLLCVRAIQNDFEYSIEKDVEHLLWQAHTYLNGEYRKVIGQLGGQNLVVQKRKVDKLYRDFLKTSQFFYRGYIQRLSGQYHIPELRQVARGMDVEPAESSQQENVPPSSLRVAIVKCCQASLVRLGDLSRYRCQSSDKPSKACFDTALAYYGLASRIDPEDGTAHNQLAVLYQTRGQHLDIVYHFYRAISIAKPHGLATRNLEREFKIVANQSHTHRTNSKDLSELLISWFLSLHAHFFRGEQFSQQSELEDEVLHRFGDAMRSGGHESLLLKLMLINIAAYDVATEKVKAAGSLKSSQSCQFLLRFNVRTISIITGQLLSILRSSHDVSSILDEDEDEGARQFSKALDQILPSFRLYLAWFSVTQSDFVQHNNHLEPHITEVYKLLASTLTLLYSGSLVCLQNEVHQSSYLLPEDTEAIGLKPLSDRQLPLFWKTEKVNGIYPSKVHRSPKPTKELSGGLCKPYTETLWRIRDILYCGVNLAASSKLPLTIVAANGNPAWKYVDGQPLIPCIDEDEKSRVLGTLKMDSLGSPTNEDYQNNLQSPHSDMSLADREGVDSGRFTVTGFTHPAPSDSSRRQGQRDLVEQQPRGSLFDQDLSEDSEMVKMVDNLLGPNEGHRSHEKRSQDETSYGVGSSTADVFTRFVPSPAQPSPSSKTIPNLPWNYFYTPAPQHKEGTAMSPINDLGVLRDTASGFEPAAEPRVKPALTDALGEPDGQTFRGSNFSSPRQYVRSPGDTLRHRPTMNQGPSEDERSPLDMTDDARRKAVLDSLAASLMAQHGGASQQASSAGTMTPPYNLNNSGPQTSPANVTGMLASAGDRAAHMDLVEPRAGPQMMDTVDRRSRRDRPTSGHFQRAPRDLSFNFPKSPFEPQPLSPPQASAPAGAVFVRPGQGHLQAPSRRRPGSNFDPGNSGNSAVGPFQEQLPSNWNFNVSSPGSALAFSHPSSLYAGTPAPPGSVDCNGVLYNATTPFGRMGGVNQREDPTHFRNVLKETVGDSDNSYDKQVLQSALLDMRNKTRPK